MTTPTITAQAQPVQPIFSHKRVSTRNLRKPIKQASEHYHFASELSPEIIQDQLMFFCKEFADMLVERTAFSTTIDETGVSMTISSPDFHFSIIYNEMNGGTAQ